MLRRITSILICVSFCVAASAFADVTRAKKKKKPGIAVTLSEVTQTSYAEKPLWCLTKQSPARPGKLVQRGNKLFFVVETTKKKMKKLKEKKSSLGRKKFKKRKQKIFARQAALEAACHGGGNGGPLPPGAISLEPLGRPATAEDLRYLLEKAGFGNGKRDASVMSIGLSQGLGAAVQEFMRTKAEDSGLITRAINHLDEDLEENHDWVTQRGIRRAWTDIKLHTNNAFREKLAIFLLSLWTTAADGVDSDDQMRLMWDYIQLIRTSAYKPDMRLLAKQVTTSPMMLLYLDGATNVKNAPNQNYARELMELFTVGPRNLDGVANYTEAPGDIAKLSRRLTGWKVISQYDGQWPPTWLAVFSPAEHAYATETLFEGTPHACAVESYDEVINCIFDKHPNAPLYYAKELLEYYVTPNPPRKLIENFAALIKQHNFNLNEPLRTLFLSKAFHSDAYKNTIIKNPIEYTLEFVRTLDLPVVVQDWAGLEWQIERMGMGITKAPSVFWWNNSAWSSPPVNLEKHNMIMRFLRDTELQEDLGWTPAKVLPKGAEITARQVLQYAAQRLGVPLDAEREERLHYYMTNELKWDNSVGPFSYDNRLEESQRYKGLGVYAVLALTPEFQLK